MILTRRKFLKACGAALAVGVGGNWSRDAEAITGRRHWMVEELTRSLFEKHVGKVFTVAQADGTRVALKLTRAEDVQGKFTKHQGGPALETFALIFEGPAATPLRQGTFTFAHDTLGTFDLFMVPVVSHTPEVRNYEVMISRLLTK